MKYNIIYVSEYFWGNFQWLFGIFPAITSRILVFNYSRFWELFAYTLLRSLIGKGVKTLPWLLIQLNHHIHNKIQYFWSVLQQLNDLNSKPSSRKKRHHNVQIWQNLMNQIMDINIRLYVAKLYFPVFLSWKRSFSFG